jgi:ABC transport system ATP-binding/permease protein
MICVDAARIGAAQPDKMLFDELSVTISSGDRVAVVGINGSGKSTLLRMLTGSEPPDGGEVRFGRGLRMAVLDQDPKLPPGTVAEVLGDSWEVARIAQSLGVDSLLERRTNELSGGQAKRVALAVTLVGEHDLIVLDEPTNHLDLEAIEWLEERLLATSSALLLVTHDRHVLDRLTTKVIELDRGKGYIHDAKPGASAYAAYLDGRAEREAHEASAEATRKILARKELAWLQRGAPARSTKPKARLRSAAEIISGGPQAAGVRGEALSLSTGMARLGNQVVELEGVTQAYGDHTVLRNVDLVLEPGARLGVVGPNGSGKSTLLDLIAARTQPTRGTVRRGTTVVVGYADQQSSTLDPEIRVRNLVAGPHREPDWRDTQLMERFWFDSTSQWAPTRLLSGGERRRLQLVMVLAAQPNLLVLDEPTNDLDLDTLRALEDFLDDWPGALMVASHDRAFLDRTIDHLLAIEPGGAVRPVRGGVEGWLADRMQARATPAPKASGPKNVSAGTSNVPGPTHGRKLRQTEQALEKASAERDRLGLDLAEAAPSGDHERLAALGRKLAEVQAKVDELEELWLELADG